MVVICIHHASFFCSLCWTNCCVLWQNIQSIKLENMRKDLKYKKRSIVLKHSMTIKIWHGSYQTVPSLIKMKGSPCCAGLMRSCLHTYRTKTNLTQHIIQPWGGISQVWGGISQVWGAINQLWGAISQVWGGHQPSMGGHQPSMGGPSVKYGGPSAKYGGVINQLWGGHQPSMGGSSTNYGGAISQVWGGGYFPTSMYRKSKSRELL